MSERPTEALQRRIDGDGQGLMFKDGQPVPMRPVPISELREAVDTIAALTAEVELLRAFSNAVQDIDLDVYDLARKHAALTPPAEQPAPEDDNAVSGEGGG